MAIRFSEVLGKMKGSDLGPLLALTAQPDIISFAGGLPAPITFPLKELEEVAVKVRQEDGAGAMQYGPSLGFMGLREAIAARMNRMYVPMGMTEISAKNIMIVTGSQQGLDITGRVFHDIRILPTKDEYVNDRAYYIIECKRLNTTNPKGATGLNAEYVKNGICRFSTGYYSSYFGCSAMFGFLVEPVNTQKDIVNNINSMLNTNFIDAQGQSVNANAIQRMQYENFADGYSYSYVSKHTYCSGDELVLYHLMFDFSKNIQ